MGLMDAKEYDPRPAQRLWRLVAIAGAILIVFLILWFWPTGRFRYFSQIRVIDRFLTALQKQDFETAYGIYHGDPDWKQHPQKYSEYPLPQFKLDWGPSSEYGPITSHRFDCATQPRKQDFQSPSGVIVVVTINNRSESTSLWVENKDKSITIPPVQALCHPPK